MFIHRSIMTKFMDKDNALAFNMARVRITEELALLELPDETPGSLLDWFIPRLGPAARSQSGPNGARSKCGTKGTAQSRTARFRRSSLSRSEERYRSGWPKCGRPT